MKKTSSIFPLLLFAGQFRKTFSFAFKFFSIRHHGLRCLIPARYRLGKGFNWQWFVGFWKLFVEIADDNFLR